MSASVLLIASSLVLGATAQVSASDSGFNTMSPPSNPTGSNNTSSVSAQATMTLFADQNYNQEFVGSVVAADACATTVVLRCTAGDYGPMLRYTECSGKDGFDEITFTYQGSTSMTYAYTTTTEAVGSDVALAVTADCDLEPTSRAVCTNYVSGSVEGEGKETTAISTTYEGAAATAMWYQVPITAGAEKLPPASASCTAAPQGENGAAPLGLVELYKVVIVPGAAALLAGAAAL